jgi:hypothetical protein
MDRFLNFIFFTGALQIFFCFETTTRGIFFMNLITNGKKRLWFNYGVLSLPRTHFRILVGNYGVKKEKFHYYMHPMICATFCVRLPWRFHKQSFDKIYIHENDNYLLPLFISMGNTHDVWSWRDNIYSNIILINLSWVWLLYRHFKDCDWPFFKKK